MASRASTTIITLLTSNWVSANTGNKTPEFVDVTDQKRISFGENKDYIIIQRPIKRPRPAGTGGQTKHIDTEVPIDIRVFGQGNEGHFDDIVDEVERILDTNLLSPGGSYYELFPDTDWQDMSDKTRYMWRKMVPVILKEYNVSR